MLEHGLEAVAEVARLVDVRAQRALLDAVEIDKAVYEAIYESRNRPDWIGIPIAAVERLVARSAPAAGN